jgi:hypothetical protein
MKRVPIGAKGEAEQTVTFEHTLTAHDDRLPPVYSTPDHGSLSFFLRFIREDP